MRQVLVRALKNFDGYEVGQETWVELTTRTAHLIVGNYFQLLWDPTWEQGYGASGYVPTDHEGDLD
jgi:hypothetical protein